MVRLPNELEAFKMLLMAIDLNRQPNTSESDYKIRVYDPESDDSDSEDDKEIKEGKKTGKLMYYFLESRGKTIDSNTTATNLCLEIKPTTLLEMLAISRISGYPYDKVVFSLCFRPIIGADISNGVTQESVGELMRKLPNDVLRVLYEKCNGDVYETCQSRPGYFAMLVRDSFRTITEKIEKTYLDSFDKSVPAEPQKPEEEKESSSVSPGMSTPPPQEAEQQEKDAWKKTITQGEIASLEDDDDDDFEEEVEPREDVYADVKRQKATDQNESEHGKESSLGPKSATNKRKETYPAPLRKKARKRGDFECDMLIRDLDFYPKPVRVYGYSSLDEITSGNVVWVKKSKYPEELKQLMEKGKEYVPQCSCEGKCNIKTCSCIKEYDLDPTEKELVFKWGENIVECGSKCKCSIECPNRVIQRGPKYELELFKTEKKGIGVRAGEDIPAGSYIYEYVGEIITNKEADSRGESYDKGHCSYLFNLSSGMGDKKSQRDYVIDAMYYGNITRFFNHSCQPNMQKNPFWIEHCQENIPRIAFFSARDIKKHEELTFDYEYKIEKKIRCFCGAPNCKGWLL